MKINKVTIIRINEHSNLNSPDYLSAIKVVADILNRSAVILGESGRYEINDRSWDLLQPVIFNDGEREFVSGQTSDEYETRIVRGLATRYPHWISGTLGHGLNGVWIYDVNKLVEENPDHEVAFKVE